jgi:hypothetical protein
LIGNAATAISTPKESERMDISRFLIVLGLAIVAAGLFWPFITRSC